ncbi:MAG: TIGR04283 family arsenosugar biosynthesis glycosyltransferase [Aerococcus sp.]|nr:TIGR04283 family arsenosugar biosynthesis glycosyltransferase [Aerococcus sp.]
MISIIIPVRNEANNLPDLFQQLACWQKTEACEVIFVDGESQDATSTLIEKQGYRLIRSPKGRGEQLKRGVQVAKGEILFFLHADSKFEHSPLPAINATCQTHDFGAFSLHYQNAGLGLWLIAWGASWRVKHRHIAFGDQGMFIKREVYQQLGGFHSLPLMEDYEFSLRAKRVGIHCQLVSERITSSDRYFQQHGILRSWYRMQRCQWLFRRGAAIEQIQAIYYQK